jgi:hypothetical protein
MYVLNLYRRIIVSSDGIEPFDWSRQVGLGRRGLFDDIFRGFDEMRREMDREFEGIEKRIQKDLVSKNTLRQKVGR